MILSAKFVPKKDLTGPMNLLIFLNISEEFEWYRSSPYPTGKYSVLIIANVADDTSNVFNNSAWLVDSLLSESWNYKRDYLHI
jgi:hypothetical protein